jgi:hypothetical protein
VLTTHHEGLKDDFGLLVDLGKRLWEIDLAPHRQ